MVQNFENLQLSIFVFLILKDTLDGHDFECLFVPGLVDDSEGAIADFILTGVAGSAYKAGGVLGIGLAAVEGEGRGLLLVENSVDGCAVGLSESVSVFGLGVQFGGVLEGDAFDRLGLLERQGFVVMVGFFMFLERGPCPLGLVKADFLGIFIHLGANPAGAVVLVGADFDLQVAEHATNTIKRHYYIKQSISFHNSS